MITIYYNNRGKADEWAARLDSTFSKYQLIAQDEPAEPKLTDGEKQFEGDVAIDSYVESIEQFVKGWYEDRCDKYEFDADEQHAH